MVVKERDINELILQIFEEQEETFYFPINSQKEAKAFVKALNTKGLPYETLCEDIGESEHSFNTWRKSLSRPGVGQRVIERINQPFVSLLQEDTEALMTGTRKSVNGFKAPHTPVTPPSRQQNGHHDTPKSAKAENEVELAARLNRARNRLQMQETKKREEDEEEEEEEEDAVFSTPNSTVSTPHVAQTHGSPSHSNSSSSTPFTTPSSAPCSPKKLEKSGEECLAEIRRSLKHRADNVDLVPHSADSEKDKQEKDKQDRQTHSHSHQHSHKDGDSSPSDDNSEGSSKVSGLLQKFEHKFNPLRRRSSSVSSKSSSEEDISRDSSLNSPISPRSPVVKDRSKQVKRSRSPDERPEPSERKPDKVDRKDETPNVERVKEEAEKIHITEEKCTERVKKSPSLEKCSSPERSRSCTSTGSEKRDKSVSSDSEEETNEDTENHVTEIQDEIEDEPQKPEESMEAKAERLAEEAKAEVSSIRRQISERMEAARKQQASRKSSNEVDIHDIDENYNSDLDPDNEDQSPVLSTLVQKISTMRSTGKNGPGYLYVFSDSYGDEVRVKVGTSRFPNKRLRQAQVFNPDLWQVLLQPVNQRITALNELTGSLERHAEPDTKLWFKCHIDTVIEAAEKIAGKYASKSITNNGDSSMC